MSIPVDIDQLVYSRVHPDPSITVRDLEAAIGRFLSLYSMGTVFKK